MKKTFIFFLSFGFLVSTATAQNVFYFGQVGDGEVASIILKTTLIFVNTGASDATVKIEFLTSNLSHDVTAQAMGITLNAPGLSSCGTGCYQITLKKGESFSVQTAGTDSLKVGYAKVTAPASVGGTAVFTREDKGTKVILYEAGVPASPTLTNFSLFLDSLKDKDTGLAVVNTADTRANVRLRLYNKAFSEIATTQVALAPGAHRPRFINEIFTGVGEASEMEGSVTVESDKPLAAVTLRQNDSGQPFPQAVPVLAAFPVISGRADTGVAGSFSVIASGDVLVTLDLRQEKIRPLGAIYGVYSGDRLVREVLRSFDSETAATEVIALPRSGEIKPAVTRVEARLIYTGGDLGSRFDLSR